MNVRLKKHLLVALLCVFQLLSILLIMPAFAMQQNSQLGSLSGPLMLDLYTNRGGIGTNTTGGIFYPGDEIVLYANVTYNGDGVADVLVSYEIMNPVNQDLVLSTAIADSQGIAKINFTIPSTPIAELFGTWTAIATTSVAQMFASDRLTFQVTRNQTSIPGDVNDDGIVDIGDATLVGLWWGSMSPPAPANVDIDHDGVIGISDAAIIGSNWLKHA